MHLPSLRPSFGTGVAGCRGGWSEETWRYPSTSMSTAWRSIAIDRVSIAQGSLREPLLDVRIDALESARMQTLRGIACLLLVAFHAVGAKGTSGLHVPDDSAYREFTNLFVYIRMPLFTFLSGFVYAYRPVRAGHGLQFAGKKLRRLGVPLIVASTLLYLVRSATHDGASPLRQMWTIYVFPYYHLWFVQGLLLVFAVIVVLESLGALSTVTRFMIVLALSVAPYYYGPFERHNVLAIHEATYLLPFFLWGLGANRYRDVLQSRRALIATFLCFVVTQGLHTHFVLTHTLGPIDPDKSRSAFGLLIGMSASLCAVQLVPSGRLMGKLGTSSYPIYLYHPLFINAVHLGAGPWRAIPMVLVFVARVIVGVVGPMLMERVARQMPFGQLLLEGRAASAAKA